MQTGLALLKRIWSVANRIRWQGRHRHSQSDLHDIGKNLVAMMLEGAGFEIMDLGVDVPAAFVDAVGKGAQVIGMSALLTTTMSNMA